MHQFGPYTTEDLIASGPFTQVWRANGPSGEVALKVVARDDAMPTLARERAALQRVEHRGVPRLLSADPDGRWIATEWIEGVQSDLWALDKTPAAIARWGASLCHVIEHLHSRSLIHGDLKPRNVMVRPDGEPVVVDFGVATVGNDAPKGFRGTPGYVSPEVVRGQPAGRPADIYGVGATLYELLTGRMPFQAVEVTALALKAVSTLPIAPQSYRADIPGALSQVTLALLTHSPTRRPSDLTKIRAALETAASSVATQPIVGMDAERDALSRSVIAAADGGPRIVVVWGPPGSGRSTLIQEAIAAARREGLAHLKEGSTHDIVESALSTRRPFVISVDASTPGAMAEIGRLVEAMHPGLCLIRANHGLVALGHDEPIVRVTPSSLTQPEGARLLTNMAPADRVDAIWRDAFGQPGAMLARVRRIQREAGGDPSEYDAVIAPATRRVLQTLRRLAPDDDAGVAIARVAASIGLDEHEVVDHLDLLEAEGLVQITDEGDGARMTLLARHVEDEV